jgi:hypothetical protein
VSFSGLGGGWIDPPQPVPDLYDYLRGGVGLTELQRMATQASDLLISGKSGPVPGIRSSQAETVGSPQYTTANPIIAAIWNGQTSISRILAALVVNTMVQEQAAKAPKDRKPAFTLAWDVVPRVTSALLNNGDPSEVLMNLQEGMSAWKNVANVIQGRTPTGWCEREFILSSSTPGQPLAVCKLKMDASGAMKPIAAQSPPAGAVLVPQTAAAYTPQPPPTHAQINAQVDAQIDHGESLEHLEAAQELSELGMYLGSLAQARVWMTLGLHIPTNSTDAQVWAALMARGIHPAEALDWFTGCDAGLDCFRQRMNRALGEADERTRNVRSKLLVGAGVLGAVVLAAYTLKRGGR